MRRSTKSLKRFTALAASLILAAGPGSAILGSESTVPLQIGAVAVEGNLVQVSVSNLSGETLSGTVHVRALLDDRVAEAMADVTLAAGQTVALEFEMSGPVHELECGVVLEDGSPF